MAAARAVAQAFAPFVVKDIRVEGLQRTEAGTVFSYLPVKVGETMNEREGRAGAARAVTPPASSRTCASRSRATCWSSSCEERPAIAQIDFSGIKEFDTDTVRKVLRELGIAEGRIFDRSVLDRAEQELKRQYLSRGLYAAEVQTTVTPLERNRVGINFAVTEGDVAKIRGINIVGAQAFTESELLETVRAAHAGLAHLVHQARPVFAQKLAADLETLRSFYQNRGYLDFTLESTQVSITPDRQDIYITINITEGEKYTVSDVQLAGQLLRPARGAARR